MGRPFIGVEKSCRHCGKSFRISRQKSLRTHYCSRGCRDAHEAEHGRSKRGASVALTCEHCGSRFWIKKSHSEGRRYCSRECMNAHEADAGRPAAQVSVVGLVCKQCGKSFVMKPSYLAAYRKKFGRDPLYCSIPCSALGRKADADARAVTNLRCIQCGGPLPETRKPSGFLRRGRNCCSAECRSLYFRLKKQAASKLNGPTRRVMPNGYIQLYVPGTNGSPHRDIAEHRYVMEQHLGRPLLPDETVHHIDGNRARNVIENLELFSSRHGPGQRVIDKVEFAIEILRLYPEFAKSSGVMLTEVAH